MRLVDTNRKGCYTAGQEENPCRDLNAVARKVQEQK